MKLSGWLLAACFAAGHLSEVQAASEPLTPVHAENMCAMYGNCGKKSLFGAELPCISNTPAVVPEAEDLDFLVGICGDEWKDQLLCCDRSQMENLQSNLKKAENLIASCPACQKNFYDLFCHFTCSPNQSQFVDIVSSAQSLTGKSVVSELNYFLDPQFASGFFDSCKEIKFSATNGYAMDLIGGGARNYTAFLKFLGDEKPMLGGSPFQMNFPWTAEPPVGGSRLKLDAKPCDSSDPAYRCACPDCATSCPVLPPVAANRSCRVGVMPCFSFAVIMVYSGLLVLYVLGYGGVSLWRSHSRRRADRSRIFSDSLSVSDSGASVASFAASSEYYKLVPRSYALNRAVERLFASLGFFCASRPAVVLLTALAVTGALSLGMFALKLETDPVRLWVPPNDPAFRNKQYFDSTFGPFYRTTQVYVSNASGPVLSYDTAQWWFGVEAEIAELEVEVAVDGNGNSGDSESFFGSSGSSSSSSTSITLSDVCFSPLGSDCVVESFTQYFGSASAFPKRGWKEKLSACAASPVECLPKFQLPLKKELLFGKYPAEDILESEAFVVTWVLRNGPSDSATVRTAEAWETAAEVVFARVASEAESRGLRLSYSTESSLEKELNRSSNTDGRIVALSYLCMFIYASVALGGFSGGAHGFTRKVSLGLAGILLVLLSVAASVGFFALIGVKATLIIAEVIPFLVLAVGVDNIFLLVHEVDAGESGDCGAEGAVSGIVGSGVGGAGGATETAERVAAAVARVGPSILLAAGCEVAAFALAVAVPMPAVRNFALYAAGAVAVNAALQLTAFVALLALELRRRTPNSPATPRGPRWARYQPRDAAVAEQLLAAGREPPVARILRRRYIPWLLSAKVRPVVLVGFALLFGAALMAAPHVPLGLDQRLAVPADSHLATYFDDLALYLNVGPPVYFVVRDTDVTERESQRKLCGRFSGCAEASLVNILEQERKRQEVSLLSDPPASWLDDFFQFLNPSLDQCCRVKRGTNGTEICGPYAPSRQCEPCLADHEPAWSVSMEGFPEGEEFMRWLEVWLDAPSQPCPLGGKAAYSGAVVANEDGSGVRASYFRSAHVPLRTQADFIAGYAAGNRVAAELAEATEADVFAYSHFYIFFAQYGSLVALGVALVAAVLGVAFIVAAVLLGSLRTAGVLVSVTCMVVACEVAAMSVCGVALNGVSLVNLVICAGIAVEFSAHIVRAYTFVDYPAVSGDLSAGSVVAQRRQNRLWRSTEALRGVGGTVLTGIAGTKLLGVSVLAFTRSKIFEVYYFRMWLSLVVICVAHSLVFLPVLLSYVGGDGYVKGSDGGVRVAAARMLEGPPFRDEPDSGTSADTSYTEE